MSHSEKTHDLSDLFDIALTALAYLSFGMFIIHVIMCISMTVDIITIKIQKYRLVITFLAQHCLNSHPNDDAHEYGAYWI